MLTTSAKFIVAMMATSLLLGSCSTDSSKTKALEEKIITQQKRIEKLEKQTEELFSYAYRLENVEDAMKNEKSSSNSVSRDEQIRNIQARLDRHEDAINQVYRSANAANNKAREAANPLYIH